MLLVLGAPSGLPGNRGPSVRPCSESSKHEALVFRSHHTLPHCVSLEGVKNYLELLQSALGLESPIFITTSTTVSLPKNWI